MAVTKSFPSGGLCCPGCAKNVMSAVGDIEGVESVDADHGEDEVEVTFDDSVSEDDITREIERAGCGMG